VTIAVFACSRPVQALTVSSSNFNDLRQGSFAWFPGPGISSAVLPFTSAGVTFTISPSGQFGQHQIGQSFSFTATGGNNPSSQYFFGRPFAGPVETVIDFSQPLVGFGVTFHQYDGVLLVYDGPGATGNLLGSVVGTPPPPTWSADNRPVDFVAIISDLANIRSAKVYGNTSRSDYGVSGFGISTVVPEPSTILLAICGIAMVGCVLRRSKVMR